MPLTVNERSPILVLLLRGRFKSHYIYMSKEKTIHELLHEIKIINEKIDMKIIRGKSYKKEAKRHKFLVAHLDILSRRTVRTPGLRVARSFSFA